MADWNETQGEMLLVSLAAIAAECAKGLFEAQPELAKLFGDEVATRFSKEWGGDTLYVPKGRVFQTSAIHRQIWDRFNGRNHRELAKELGVSLQHVYRVVKAEYQRDRAERQRQLPGVSE